MVGRPSVSTMESRLTLPVLLGATETGSIVKHPTGEGLSSSPHHIPQLIQAKLPIFWLLPDIDSARARCLEPESRVAGETAIIILHQMLEVVPNGNWDLTLVEEVTCSSREECREGTGEVARIH